MAKQAVSLLVCVKCGKRIEGVSTNPERALAIAEQALTNHLKLCKGSGVHHSMGVRNV